MPDDDDWVDDSLDETKRQAEIGGERLPWPTSPWRASPPSVVGPADRRRSSLSQPLLSSSQVTT